MLAEAPAAAPASAPAPTPADERPRREPRAAPRRARRDDAPAPVAVNDGGWNGPVPDFLNATIGG